MYCGVSVFFFNDTATTEIYTLSLHDALPDLPLRPEVSRGCHAEGECVTGSGRVQRLPPVGWITSRATYGVRRRRRRTAGGSGWAPSRDGRGWSPAGGGGAGLRLRGGRGGAGRVGV